MPDPSEERWAGWAAHWISANACPLWLSAELARQPAVPEHVRARLAWRLYKARADVLSRAVADPGGTLMRSLTDAGLPPDEAGALVEHTRADVARRRSRLGELEVLGTLAAEHEGAGVSP